MRPFSDGIKVRLYNGTDEFHPGVNRYHAHMEGCLTIMDDERKELTRITYAPGSWLSVGPYWNEELESVLAEVAKSQRTTEEKKA